MLRVGLELPKVPHAMAYLIYRINNAHLLKMSEKNSVIQGVENLHLSRILAKAWQWQ